jgi:predicted Holliday junction resolvase-like endonuclease
MFDLSLMSSIILVLGILFMTAVSFNYRRKWIAILSQKKSSEVRLGQTAEHLVPFLRQFKYDPKRAHFLGMPVDYIIFEEDKIIFLEIKTGAARLNNSQQQIKKLVADGKVVWEEMRIDSSKPVDSIDRTETLNALTKAGIEVKL